MSVVICPRCGGSFGVRRIEGDYESLGVRSQARVEMSRRFKCLDCGAEFRADGYAWVNEMGKVG